MNPNTIKSFHHRKPLVLSNGSITLQEPCILFEDESAQRMHYYVLNQHVIVNLIKYII